MAGSLSSGEISMGIPSWSSSRSLLAERRKGMKGKVWRNKWRHWLNVSFPQTYFCQKLVLKLAEDFFSASLSLSSCSSLSFCLSLSIYRSLSVFASASVSIISFLHPLPRTLFEFFFYMIFHLPVLFVFMLHYSPSSSIPSDVSTSFDKHIATNHMLI